MRAQGSSEGPTESFYFLFSEASSLGICEKVFERHIVLASFLRATWLPASGEDEWSGVLGLATATGGGHSEADSLASLTCCSCSGSWSLAAVRVCLLARCASSPYLDVS